LTFVLQEVPVAFQETSESGQENLAGNTQHFNDDQLDYETESLNGDAKLT
jgi:hypothetical protein